MSSVATPKARPYDPRSQNALHAVSRAVALIEPTLRRADTTPRTRRAVPQLPASSKDARRQHRATDFARAVLAGNVNVAERSLEHRIRAHLSKGRLEVTLTDNRYTMISVRRENTGRPFYRVRLHHMFSGADPLVTRALARYIAKNDRRASSLLGDYIDSNQHRVRPRRRHSEPSLITGGEYHDLDRIYADLNERYFAGAVHARITWGQRTGRPRRRNSIKMGSYSVEDKLIRIHRSLDRGFVPRFFVEWIVYHEMLHQVHEVRVVNGRRQFHPKVFLEDEAKFEHYAPARSWERAHLDELLTY